MKLSPEICRDDQQRRRDIREHTDTAGRHDLNGIEYLEVDENQIILTVYFVGPVPPNISINNIRIDGGIRIRNIKVRALHRCDPKDPRVDGCLQIEVVTPGDFSTYTLRLVNTDARGRPGDTPLDGFDPRYAQLDFSFKVNCPSELDCAPQKICPPEPLQEIEINYLAKDYASFRQLILDRLSLIMPDWKERHVPDVGIALVEVLAYVGDYLSYYQDAVATEAYLNTARQRISVRRHARLVDYTLSEGCNARAWVYVELGEEHLSVKAKDFYLVSSRDRSLRTVLSSDDLRDVPFSTYEVFEPMIEEPTQVYQLYQAHNSISFYTWNDRECCLPRGATSATLKDQWAGPPPPQPSDPKNYPNDLRAERIVTASGRARKQVGRVDVTKSKEKKKSYQEPEPEYQAPPPRPRRLHLEPGDVLIFEEMFGPVTGVAADADAAHRHVVRLTKVEPDVDPLYDEPILRIEWSVEDALPFMLCISAIGRSPDCTYFENISVAHGNVLLVDHGRRVGSTGIEASESWTVPAENKHEAGCWAANEPREEVLGPGKFAPRLRRTPLTYCAPFPRPAEVARQQARLISQLMSIVHGRVEQLWRSARDGRPLTADEIIEMRTIFGPESFSTGGGSAAEAQAKELQRLLEHEESLLARKARRVRDLMGRARAGYLIGENEETELREMFGAYVVAKAGIRSRKTLGPATQALAQDPQDALPSVRLREQNLEDPTSDGTDWLPQKDLLESDDEASHFVVEIDNYGRAHLRFGDGDRGRAPVPNSVLTASYRVGNGTRGNVGAEAISHFVFRQPTSGVDLRVRNPFPARGGSNPELISRAKLFAPMSFRRQLERAVTRDDYALLARRSDPAHIQQTATGPLRWTGSHYEVQVAIDPFGKEELDRDLEEQVEGYLYRYGRIGYDLRILPARYVPLDLELGICVKEHFLRSEVEAALLELFSNRVLADGRPGFFHPDNLTFGEGIFLSRIVAAAQGVTGVESAAMLKLQRLYEEPNQEIERGILPLGSVEVARLANDRSFPEHGKLSLKIGGGR